MATIDKHDRERLGQLWDGAVSEVEAEHERRMRLPVDDIEQLRYRQKRAWLLWRNLAESRALRMFEENLNESRRLLGPAHPETHGYRETFLSAVRSWRAWRTHPNLILPHYVEKAQLYADTLDPDNARRLEAGDWVKFIRSQTRRLPEDRPDRPHSTLDLPIVREDLHPDEAFPPEPFEGRNLLQPNRSPRSSTWVAIRGAHPKGQLLAEGPMPRDGAGSVPGCLYVEFSRGVITATVAQSLGRAWNHIYRTNPDALPRFLFWVPGSESEIISSSPILSFNSGQNPLRTGRPITISKDEDWYDVEPNAGIYRIYRRGIDGMEEVYIGRSSNLRRRPFRHEKTIGREWGDTPGGILKIELLPAKVPMTNAAWTATDLDAAEALHVDRARKRIHQGGPRVLNITAGRNGPASIVRARTFVYVEPVKDSRPSSHGPLALSPSRISP